MRFVKASLIVRSRVIVAGMARVALPGQIETVVHLICALSSGSVITRRGFVWRPEMLIAYGHITVGFLVTVARVWGVVRPLQIKIAAYLLCVRSMDSVMFGIGNVWQPQTRLARRQRLAWNPVDVRLKISSVPLQDTVIVKGHEFVRKKGTASPFRGVVLLAVD